MLNSVLARIRAYLIGGPFFLSIYRVSRRLCHSVVVLLSSFPKLQFSRSRPSSSFFFLRSRIPDILLRVYCFCSLFHQLEQVLQKYQDSFLNFCSNSTNYKICYSFYSCNIETSFCKYPLFFQSIKRTAEINTPSDQSLLYCRERKLVFHQVSCLNLYRHNLKDQMGIRVDTSVLLLPVYFFLQFYFQHQLSAIKKLLYYRSIIFYC